MKMCTSWAAAMVASITAGGGWKSGSPTHSDTTLSPLAFISCVRANTWRRGKR